MMFRAMLLAATFALASPVTRAAGSTPAAASCTAQGVICVHSAHAFGDTVNLIVAAVRANKIRYFGEIDQSNLAAAAGIALRPSKLLIFGNPPLGLQFLMSNPLAGLDWPVRLLVTQDPDGQVWVAYTDFAFIAQRYAIADRSAALTMATKVSDLVSHSVAKR
jgi:uncharacterized protein (DUF302 family)